jgi:hypothetical protein
MTPRDTHDARREFLKTQLKRISAHWPLQASPEALNEYARVLWGFTDDEIASGFDIVIDSYTEAAAPKPGHIRAAVGQVAKARRNISPPEVEAVAAGLPAIKPSPDMVVIERWAEEPGNASLVQEELDRLTSSWDREAKFHSYVLYPAAKRNAYERAHQPLRVMR